MCFWQRKKQDVFSAAPRDGFTAVTKAHHDVSLPASARASANHVLLWDAALEVVELAPQLRDGGLED